MIKCIVCDLDGTLILSDDTIEQNTLKTLKYYMDKGIELIIATGRGMNMVTDILAKYQLTCDLILHNGTEYYNPKTKINEFYPMRYEDAKKIVQVLGEHGYLQSIHTNHGLYSLHDQDEFWDYHMKLLINSPMYDGSLPKKTYTIKEEYLKNFHFIKDANDIIHKKIDVLKIDAKHLDIASVKGIREQLRIPNLDISSSYEENMEITSNVSNKGKLLRRVLQDKGYHADETAVFGDGENDCSMLKGFKYSFTPKNACEEAKKVSTIHLNKTNNEGAVGEGITMLKDLQLI